MDSFEYIEILMDEIVRMQHEYDKLKADYRKLLAKTMSLLSEMNATNHRNNCNN